MFDGLGGFVDVRAHVVSARSNGIHRPCGLVDDAERRVYVLFYRR
jgi:hypothetical protein